MKNTFSNGLRLFILIGSLAGSTLLTGCFSTTSVSRYRFEGIVTDQADEPINNANVVVVFGPKFEYQADKKLFKKKREQSFRTLTNPDGSFRIEAHALHRVMHNVVGATLLWMITPLATNGEDMETREDVRVNMPGWLGAMVRMPAGVPQAYGTNVTFSAPGAEQITQPLMAVHERGTIRGRDENGPYYFRSFDLGEVKLNMRGKQRSGKARSGRRTPAVKLPEDAAPAKKKSSPKTVEPEEMEGAESPAEEPKPKSTPAKKTKTATKPKQSEPAPESGTSAVKKAQKISRTKSKVTEPATDQETEPTVEPEVTPKPKPKAAQPRPKASRSDRIPRSSKVEPPLPTTGEPTEEAQ